MALPFRLTGRPGRGLCSLVSRIAATRVCSSASRVLEISVNSSPHPAAAAAATTGAEANAPTTVRTQGLPGRCSSSQAISLPNTRAHLFRRSQEAKAGLARRGHHSAEEGPPGVSTGFLQFSLSHKIAAAKPFASLNGVALGPPWLQGGSTRHPSDRLIPYSIGGIRAFGGRAGGLKRRKRRRDPGVLQQTGKGRRLEFFWPRGQRLLRVPLQQNSRPSLIYDLRFRRFLCCWTSNGQHAFRPYNCRSRASGRDGGRGVGVAGAAFGHTRAGGFEAARAKALVLLRQLQRQGKLTDKLESSRQTKPEINRSGVRGVYFEPEERLWVAVWKEAGIRRFRAFSVVDLGFAAAYQAAVAVRRQQLAANYEFCMQRHRRRSGRQPLK